jgi:hypothetical protein
MWHWSQARTWIRAPIIVGFTRLGNLLGALDRQDLPESSRHRVWMGGAVL